MLDRQTLKELPSGKIELVYDTDRGYSTLQFNAHCLDCLPYCKAMCCRMRQGFTVALKPNEVGKYESREDPRNPGVHILKSSPDGRACVYLSQADSTCTIHDRSPWMCGAYHCSPEGKGDRVTHRDGGWLWTPMGCLQQLGDGTVIDTRRQATVKLG